MRSGLVLLLSVVVSACRMDTGGGSPAFWNGMSGFFGSGRMFAVAAVLAVVAQFEEVRL